jgi:hypothetical protein
LEFADALGPPSEGGSGADEVRALLKRDAADSLGLLQVLDGGEVLVGEGGIGQRPEVLGRLQLGGIGRQEEQVDVLRHVHLGTRVPAGAVQHQHDLLARAGADLPREGLQLGLEEPDADARGQMENRAPRGGMDEADQVAPLVAVLDRGSGSLAGEAPDLVQDRLEADAMLVDSPRLDARGGEGRRYIPAELADPPLNVACSAGSAARTWRGRGM